MFMLTLRAAHGEGCQLHALALYCQANVTLASLLSRASKEIRLRRDTVDPEALAEEVFNSLPVPFRLIGGRQRDGLDNEGTKVPTTFLPNIGRRTHCSYND